MATAAAGPTAAGRGALEPGAHPQRAGSGGITDEADAAGRFGGRFGQEEIAQRLQQALGEFVLAASTRIALATPHASTRWPREGRFGTTTPPTRLGLGVGLGDEKFTGQLSELAARRADREEPHQGPGVRRSSALLTPRPRLPTVRGRWTLESLCCGLPPQARPLAPTACD